MNISKSRSSSRRENQEHRELPEGSEATKERMCSFESSTNKKWEEQPHTDEDIGSSKCTYDNQNQTLSQKLSKSRDVPTCTATDEDLQEFSKAVELAMS